MSGRRLVGYLRVAPRERASARPEMDDQRRAIEAAAEAAGWSIVAWQHDRRSGRSTRRPGLLAALGAARSGDVDGVVVARLDRLTYSLPALAELLRETADGAWSVVSIEEGLDTRREDGALVARVLGTAAGWRTLPLEVKSPMLARRGRPSSTPRPVADRIRRLRAEGLSLQAICDTLNDEGVPTPRGGARWRPTSLRSILRDAPSD